MTARPLFFRLFVPFTIVMAFIVGLSIVTVHRTGERAVRRQQIHGLDQLTRVLRQWLPPSGELGAVERERVAAAAAALDARITLIAGDGTVLYDSHGAAGAMANHNDRPEVRAARAGDVGRSVRESSTLHDQAVYVARLLDPAQPQGAVVRLSFPRSAWLQAEGYAWTVLAAGVFASVLVTSVLAGLLYRAWIRPVHELAAATERMAAGDWRARAEPHGTDDLRAFSGRLNALADNAQKQVAELRHQRGDLQALVDTLPDPFLVTDASQRIILMNAPAARLLQITPAQALGHKLLEVAADAPIVAVLDEAAAGAGAGVGVATPAGADYGSDGGAVPHTLQREIQVNRDGQRLQFLAMVTRTAAGGVLLVLRDVSTLSNAMQMKADFVANASHELRTPIAAIKIAFETLRDVYREDPAQAERCVGVVEAHLRRLEEMLSDLLDLSRVESPDLQPRLSEVTADELFAPLEATLGPVARQKGVELAFADRPPGHLDGEPVRFVSDERLLSLVLKNLVENSIKFTAAGGRVAVRVARDAGRDGLTARIVLSVCDTGIGIAPEHRDRVFERFYQVNASRTGAAGRGTGLGLAIVKHAVAALDGVVQLESEVAQGTTVTCVLPDAHRADARATELLDAP